jgi:exodeoxyribonuclease V beta subunit
MITPAQAQGLLPRDWRSLDLQANGRSLIEASAGTGKTWTIAVLYLRLILENQLSPRQLVVTTFTDAAAQELRERLRGKLLWAEKIASADDAPETPGETDEAWLRARWQDDLADRTSDLQRIRLALAEMDVAPVGTLHALCARILAEHPFACGAPFVSGKLVDGRVVLDEVARDLWRRLQQGSEDDELVQLQQKVEADLTLGTLIGKLRTCLISGVTVPLVPVWAEEEEISSVWSTRLRTLVADDSVFHKKSKLRVTWEALAELIEDRSRFPAGNIVTELRDAAELKAISAARKNDDDVRAIAEFSVSCAPLLERRRQRMLQHFWHEISAVARHEIEQRQRRRNLHSFDDLLNSVVVALDREVAAAGDRALADALQQAWPVAMVDEFQDTDSVQYRILDRIYSDADGAKRGQLIMIGDPKQAIYRFRGGDIEAYRKAAATADAQSRLTLAVNHRSSSALVAALNEFFDCAGPVLSAGDADSAIHYHAVEASHRRDDEVYAINGVACAKPLVIDYREDDPGNAGARRGSALQACANQIVEMLHDGRQTINGDPLKASDIAVLLPAAANIRDLRDLLRERGVPCVTSERSSVFDTGIARELRIVLHAVVHNTDAGVVRAALATRLWGASFSELQRLEEDVIAFKQVSEIFRAWHEDWQTRGVQVVVEALLERMAARYLRTTGGERAITDLRHLGELLQEQGEAVTGAEELLVWFAAQTADGSDEGAGEEAADAARLRIESDDARVRVMTLHSSKGLEFPIVFLPLMWNHGERSGNGLPVINEDGRRVVQISKEAAEKEKSDLQDERFRVLYVAMTRAIHACHVFALPPLRPARQNSANPLQGTARPALDVLLERMQPRPGSETFAESMPHVTWRAAPTWSAETSADCVYRPVDANDEAPRVARTLPLRSTGPLEGKHSFTTLTHEHAKAALDPDASAVDESDADAAPSLDEVLESEAVGAEDSVHPTLIELAAVKGADFGNAVHAMFEHRQVGLSFSDQHELITSKLADNSVRLKPVDPVAFVHALGERLQGALDAPLGASAAPGLRLSDLQAGDLLAEMQFFFPLRQASMQQLRDICARHGEADLVPHNTRVLEGLMNGKIDLIFQHGGRYYLLDYKGNDLGERIADYQGQRLLDAMQGAHYRFQALLYAVALDRYLRQRLGQAYRRSEQLGECFYLFIRAAGLGPDAGIWRHRFADDLLDAVGAVFDGKAGNMEAA